MNATPPTLPHDDPAERTDPASLPGARWQQALAFALAALGFFLPYSTAGTNVAMLILIGLALAAPRHIVAQRPWRQPVLAAGLALLAYIALRTLPENAPLSERLSAVNRYQELWIVPLLWALLRLSTRPNALLAGLMSGALVYAAVHWVALLSPALALELATRRISAGFGLALCAFIAFEHARLRQVPRWLGLSVAAFLGLTVLFAIDGRTGHLVVLVLAGCATWRAAGRRGRWIAVAGVLVAGVLVASFSDAVRGRAAETVNAARAFQHGAVHENSSGVRLQLLRFSLDVARDHAALGTGWAGYAGAYAQAADAGATADGLDAQARAQPMARLWLHSANPHNEYLLQLGAGGVPALLLFTLWLALPVLRALTGPDTATPWAGALACFALAFAVGCVFNSLLLDYTEGHLYAALMAWALAQRRPPPPAPHASPPSSA